MVAMSLSGIATIYTRGEAATTSLKAGMSG